MSDLIKRLKEYRSRDSEWGDKVHHQICDEAAEALEVTREALQMYMFAVAQMNTAMRDGVNVHGAMSALVGAEEFADYAIVLSKAKPSQGDEK